MVAVFLTLVQTKQIRINIHKRNNTKTLQKIQNTVNTSTHVTKTPIHYLTHTYTHLHITKQVKTTTVQVKTNTVQVKTNTVQVKTNTVQVKTNTVQDISK